MSEFPAFLLLPDSCSLNAHSSTPAKRALSYTAMCVFYGINRLLLQSFKADQKAGRGETQQAPTAKVTGLLTPWDINESKNG